MIIEPSRTRFANWFVGLVPAALAEAFQGLVIRKGERMEKASGHDRIRFLGFGNGSGSGISDPSAQEDDLYEQISH